MNLKQILKFVSQVRQTLIMRTKIYKYFLICCISFLHTIPSVQAQCEWLYENRPEGSYVIEDDNVEINSQFTNPWDLAISGNNGYVKV